MVQHHAYGCYIGVTIFLTKQVKQIVQIKQQGYALFFEGVQVYS